MLPASVGSIFFLLFDISTCTLSFCKNLDMLKYWVEIHMDNKKRKGEKRAVYFSVQYFFFKFSVFRISQPKTNTR